MSKQRNFRPRGALSSNADEESATQPIAPALKAAASSAQAPARKASKGPLLSFEDDGDTAVPEAQKKKDKPKSKRPQGLPDLPQAAPAPSAAHGEYTAARLKELQRNALNFSTASFNTQAAGGGGGEGGAAQDGQAGSEGVRQGQGQGQGELPVLKLAGSFKPAVGASNSSRDDRFAVHPTAVQAPRSSSRPDSFQRPSALRPPLAVAPGPPSAGGGAPEGLDVSNQGSRQRDQGRPSQPSKQQQQQQQQAAGGAAQKVVLEVEDDEEEDDVCIPSAEMIKLAKAKREALRQARLAPDYVPLGGASRLLATGRAAPQGLRAVQGEEEGEGRQGSGSGSEPELDGATRLRFSVQGETRRASQQGLSKSISVGGGGGAGGGAGEEEDAEEVFASEQLRKAVRRQRAAMPATGNAAATAERGELWPGSSSTAGAATQQALHISQSRQEAIGQAGQAALQALREGVARLAASAKDTKTSQERTSANLASSLAKVDKLEADIKAAAERYVEAQKVRAYVADLVDCLAAKSELVEELEDSLMDLREERAGAAREATQALESELVRLASASVSAALGVLGRGGALPAAMAAAQSAAEACEEEVVEAAEGGAEEVDEFGRSLYLGRRREAEQRRRQRASLITHEAQLLAAVAAGAAVVVEEEVGGLEDAAQAARYAGRHQDIMSAAATVFADAGEEFASLGAVKLKLEEFKLKQPQQYASTYMHLSTPALLAPHVRLELLQWDPLFADAPPQPPAGPPSHQGPGLVGNGGPGLQPAGWPGVREGVHRGFDKQAWYEALFDFGMGADPSSAAAADDPDGELVPQLVRKLVLPVAAHLLAKCWDPVDMRQSAAAAAVVGDLCVYVPAEEERMADVLRCVVSSLEEAVRRCSLEQWPPLAVSASPLAAAVQFRRFRRALRVLRCIGSFEGLLARPQLAKLALGQLVHTQLMPYLRAAAAALLQEPGTAVGRLEAVALALPAAWFQGLEPEGAAPLLDLATSMATRLLGMRTSKERYGTYAERLASTLSRLGQRETAASLRSAFGLTASA